MTDFFALEDDLRAALDRRLRRRLRRRRRVTITAVAAVIGCGLSAAAIASGIAGDLNLDPTKWSILGGGTVDDGKGTFVHAQSKENGANSTFMLEQDAGLSAYQSFLLHERTLAAAQATSPVPVRVEPGLLCTPAELTRAETAALATLRAQFAPGAEIDATKTAVDAAVQGEFAGAPCKGLEFGGEQARLVYAGVMPAVRLMPGVR